MPDFTVIGTDGAESSVTVPDGYSVLSESDLEDGYVRRSDLANKDSDYMLKASMKRRMRNFVRKDEAHEDDSVIAAVLAEHEPEPGKGAKKVDIDSIKANLRKDEVDPLRAEVDKLKASVKGNSLRESAVGLFHERFTKKSPSGGPSWVEAEFGRQTAVDSESGLLLVPDGDDFRSSRNATTSNPYMTARELMQIAAKSDDYEAFLPKEPKGGGGSGDPGEQKPKGGGKGGDLLARLKGGESLSDVLESTGLGSLN